MAHLLHFVRVPTIGDRLYPGMTQEDGVCHGCHAASALAFAASRAMADRGRGRVAFYLISSHFIQFDLRGGNFSDVFGVQDHPQNGFS